MAALHLWADEQRDPRELQTHVVARGVIHAVAVRPHAPARVRVASQVAYPSEARRDGEDVHHAASSFRARVAEAGHARDPLRIGQYGIRVVTLRTGGIPESIADDFDRRDAVVRGIVASTMLSRAARLEDVGHVAAFVASDKD